MAVGRCKSRTLGAVFGERREGVARPEFPEYGVRVLMRCRPALDAAVAVAIHLKDADVVGQAVKERACEALGTECFGSFVEGQAAGNHGGAVLALHHRLA